MENQLRQNQQQEVVIVAPGDWPQRLADQLQKRSASCPPRQEVHFCSNVYEAAALVVEILRQDRRVLAYVLVDYLPVPEMQFFACWNGNDKVRTLALTAAGRHNKLSQAQSLGSDEAWILGDRLEPGLAIGQTAPPEWLKMQPESQTIGADESIKTESDVPAVGPDQADSKDSEAQDTEPAWMDRVPQHRLEAEPTPVEPPLRKPPASPEPAEPVLTNEELDALLG